MSAITATNSNAILSCAPATNLNADLSFIPALFSDRRRVHVVMKYVVITGGVVSGLGKGITSSSIGVLLQAANLAVTSIKIDPYLNSDAGTMSPYEHGEVFVLDDGGEVDLDLGNYERFLDIRLTAEHNLTTGKAYSHVINRERKGEYLGRTVQVVPHITDAIQEWIHRAAHIQVDSSGRAPDVCMIELGGTVGDIESMVFLEALRQYRYKVGSDNMCHIHVSLVPVVGAVGEPKSKPTQHGVRELRAVGLSPDIIVCRSANKLDRSIISKISSFCMVPHTHVVSVHDVSNIYKVPLLLCDQNVPALVLNCLRLNRMPPEDLPAWRTISTKFDDKSLPLVRIGIVGKYTGLSDSYLSVTKSLDHAGIANDVQVQVVFIDSAHLEDAVRIKKASVYDEAWTALRSLNGILIPGAFGYRGVEGKLLAVRHAREHRIPFLGICLGMQAAVIEYSRNVLGLENATSAEFVELESDSVASAERVVVFMPEISTTHMGGTMRLGARQTHLVSGTLAHQLYSYQSVISERHRHRYEVNPDFVDRLSAGGLIFSGVDDKRIRQECIELPSSVHPFFFGVQYHPEMKSRLLKPSPPFYGFVKAAAGKFVWKSQANQSRSTSNHVSPATQPLTADTPNPITRTSNVQNAVTADSNVHINGRANGVETNHDKQSERER